MVRGLQRQVRGQHRRACDDPDGMVDAHPPSAWAGGGHPPRPRYHPQQNGAGLRHVEHAHLLHAGTTLATNRSMGIRIRQLRHGIAHHARLSTGGPAGVVRLQRSAVQTRHGGGNFCFSCRLTTCRRAHDRVSLRSIGGGAACRPQHSATVEPPAPVRHRRLWGRRCGDVLQFVVPRHRLRRASRRFRRGVRRSSTPSNLQFGTEFPPTG